MKIPDRWLNYKKGGRIAGTRFVAFKVPLRQKYSTKLSPDESFTSEMLLEMFPDIKLIIDLTFTKKYYDGNEEFGKKRIQYEKLMCKGREIPNERIYEKPYADLNIGTVVALPSALPNSVVWKRFRFANIVDEFLSNNPENCLIGVHCTHGVNRTGYFIVRYMIEKLGFKPEEALRGKEGFNILPE